MYAVPPVLHMRLTSSLWASVSTCFLALKAAKIAFEQDKEAFYTVNSLDFNTLPLPKAQIETLTKQGFKKMTEIQAQSLPLILDNRDVLAQAKTGSGKTLAFALGVLNNLDVTQLSVQGLVLCPTRELAEQVAGELRKFASGTANTKILTLCGGVPIGPQVGSLEHGAHIIVGTPGRIEDHLFKGTLDLTQVNTLVLDEADQVLDMGFSEALENILVYLPSERQNLLFSATFTSSIESLAKRMMHDPQHVKLEEVGINTRIKQHFFKLTNNKLRFNTLRLILMQHQPTSCVVFCNTKVETKRLFDELKEHGFSAVSLHGDLEQKERTLSLMRFANKSAAILVATDVAARGLDIDDMDMVINYHMALDPKTHVHRVGRTGRGDKKGLACTLYGEKEVARVAQLEKLYDREFPVATLPALSLLDKPVYKPQMHTLQLSGGKKQKVRPADIVGCLTTEQGIGFSQIGKINVFENNAYVAVARDAAKPAFRKLRDSKIKGRKFSVKRIS